MKQDPEHFKDFIPEIWSQKIEQVLEAQKAKERALKIKAAKKIFLDNITYL